MKQYDLKNVVIDHVAHMIHCGDYHIHYYADGRLSHENAEEIIRMIAEDEERPRQPQEIINLGHYRNSIKI